MDPEIVDHDLGVPGRSVHRLDLADLVPAVGGQVDEERGVRRLRHLGIVLGAGDEDREVRPVGVGDEPLVPVEHPLLAVLVALGLDQRRIGPGHLGLGHREARPRRARAQRAEVLLLLLVRAPVEERVHVALVGRLAVEHPRAVVRLRRLGLHHRQLDVAEPHAAPLRRHVREPQPGLLRLLAHPEQRAVVRLAVGLLEVLGLDPLLRRLDHVVDERPHPGPQLLQLRREAEVDHDAAPVRRPLLGEGERSFLGVLGREDVAQERRLELPELRLGPALGLSHDLLARGHRQRRVAGDALGELHRDLDGRARLGHARHQPVLVRLLGGDGIGGERHLHRHAVGDPPGQPEQGAAGGEEPDSGLRDAELDALRRDQEVARERQLEPAGEGEALDRGDQRFAGPLGEELVESLGHPLGEERLEVHPGAEAASGAGQHAGGEPVVAVELVHGGEQALAELGVDRVPLVGTVERDQQHPPPGFGQDDIGHVPDSTFLRSVV